MYALITYAGLAAVVVCTMELLKPFLTFIPQEYLTLFVFAIDIAVADPGRGHDPEAEFEDGGGRRKIITSPNTGTDRIPTGRRIRKRKNKCEQIVTGDVDFCKGLVPCHIIVSLYTQILSDRILRLIPDGAVCPVFFRL